MAEPLYVFSDYACPWCYLGVNRLKKALRGTGVTAQIIHFPLAPDTPEEGRDVRSYLEAKGIDVDRAIVRMGELLEAEGLPYETDLTDKRTWNTRRAQQLAAWAITQPEGGRIHDVLFRAYHVDNVNVHDTDVLVGLAAEIGLDPDQARAAIDAPASVDTVDRHWATARQSGVSAVPTFVAGGHGVQGAQDVEVLQALVARGFGAPTPG